MPKMQQENKNIELDAPNVGELEKQYLAKAIDSGFVSTFGPFVTEFEEKLASYIHSEKIVLTQSGTAAIHLALHELGIGKNDEVIVPATTFVASVNPILYVGAKPVFVDIDIKTWNICSEEIKKNINKNTRAVIPVHLYGNPCRMDEIMEIAGKNNLFVIEDAAQSLGAKYNNKATGTYGDFGCLSFNGNKIITTGGGGAIAGEDTKKIEHIKFLVNQAKDVKDQHYHPEVGFNYRMTNLEASLGLAQMERLEGFLVRKREFNEIYKEELKGISKISFQEEYKSAISSYWITCIVFQKPIDIVSLQRSLKNRGIPTRRIYMPIVEFPPYKQYKISECKNSYYLFERGLCLPSSTLNSKNDILYVCKVLKELI